MNLYLLVIILNLESEENGCIYVPLLVPKSYTYSFHLMIRKSPALNCGLKIFCGLLNRTSEAKKKKKKTSNHKHEGLFYLVLNIYLKSPPPFFLNLPFGSLAYFLQGKMHGECITHLRYKLNIKKDA